MCLESAAWATKTRLERDRVIAAANESAGRTVVRALKILAPGTVPMREPADADPEPEPAPAGPVRTRIDAPRCVTMVRDLEPAFAPYAHTAGVDELLERLRAVG